MVPRLVIMLGLVALAAIGAWLLRDLDGRPGSQGSDDILPLPATPFTSYPGIERMPAISPDGMRIAFAWSGDEEQPDSDQFEVHIYVKQANTEVPLQLTHDAGVHLNPEWSPDGTSISYFHADEDGAGISIVPGIGGEPRPVITADGLKPGHAWSPDGGSIVYAEARGLFIHDLATGEQRRLTVPPVSCCGDQEPVFSPDGEVVAFVRIDSARLEDLYLVEAGGGQPRRLTRGLLRLQGFDWARDGESLVCSSVRSGRYELWRVDAEDGSLTPVPTRGDWAVFPSIGRRADRMVYMDLDLIANIWRTQLGEEFAAAVTSEPVISSTRVDLEAAYSSDGDRIAFTSNRSGSMELWTCRADGSGLLRLTSFGGILVAGPHWSPDNETIAFSAVPGGSSVVYLVDADGGGPPRRLTWGDHNDGAAGWSRDGSWLYIASDRSGGWQLYRMRLDDPGGTVEPVTTQGGMAGIESPDGRTLYVARPDRVGLWALPLVGGAPKGDPVKVVDGAPVPGLYYHWDVCDDGIVFARYGRGSARFDIYRAATGELDTLVPSAPEISSISLSVSPDCRSILFGHVESGSADLMLVEGFQ